MSVGHIVGEVEFSDVVAHSLKTSAVISGGRVSYPKTVRRKK
jgi:hypothetical protein